jgi:hypothetical protein
LVKLWTFENQTKTNAFTPSLEIAGITFELVSKGTQKTSNSEVTIMVEDREYEQAKRLLMRHKKRKTAT